MGRKSEINKKDLLNLYEISDEEFARITDNLYSQKIDYKSLPNLVLLPNVKEELRNELNIKGNLYITKNRLLHTNPIRKNAHKKQGFTKDEYKAIPDTIRKATYALKETDSEYNSFLITALDKNDSTKANCIIFDEDKNGNLLTTIKKVPILSLRNRTYQIVGTGVEPAISNALREPSTTLTTSPNNQNLITKEDFVKTQAYANIEERNVALERTSDMENITADEAARIYLAQELKVNIPELTESERAAAIAIMEAGAASMQTSISDYIQNTFPDGIFGDFSKTQDAAHQQGVEINGAVSVRGFGDSVKATIYAGKTADFSTWVHELSHVWQAQLSGKLKNDAEKAFQVKDGNWQKSIYTFEDGHTDTSAEAFAYGFEDFLKKKAGEMAAEDKKAIFEKFADYMARTYNGTKEHIKINENISKVYEQFVRLDDNILAQAEKAVQQEKEFNKNLSENERQRIAVRERYKDTDLWLKAPNGKISNLTEEQWVTVHTPNFKRWFGNWDYDENKKIEPVELNLASVEFNHNNAREVEKWMKENLSGKSVEVSSSGAKVLFFNKGLQDSLKRHGEIQRDSYSVMESLVENAELFDFVANDGKDKHKGILGQDIYYSALKVDDKYYSVQFKFNVSGKYFTDSYKDHKIAEIKIAPLPYRGSNNAHADTSAIHSFTISELTGGVKPEFSKVIDANGEPLVVYHGSPNSSFDVFDRNKIGTTTDYGLYGKGFYFSNQKPQAEMYGETTEVFLNIRKPLSIDDFNSPEQLANELDAYPEYFVMQNGRVKPSGSFTGFDLYLEAKNYDGVLVKQTESLNEIVSFKPNQIKSAANNNGNFDINNDSILFQLVGERSIMRMAQNEERKRILEDLAAAKMMDEKYSNIEPSLKATRIRFATGWEKSADGQWKYELDDSLNRIKSGSLFEKILSTSPEMLEQLTKNTTLTLDDIMEAPELYGVFPFMKNVRVGFYSDPNAFRAVLTPDGIKINTKYLDGISGEKGMKGVLAHEIQHIIQAVEYSGSTGINGESIEQLYNNMMEAMKAASIKRYDYDVSSLEHGLSEYMHDSGEIEARNVARRIFMNASERRHTTLESTEDIARNLQFQIIGEQGAGELDRNTETNERIANLDTAKKMEEAAKDAKAIRLATGWEKGVDGKWKYEIDDSKVHFNLYDAMEEWDELHPRYEELREKFFKTGLSEEEQKEFDQWIDERNEVSDKHTDMDFSEKLFGKTFKLPEVMRHNELFKAYPELKDVTVSIQRTGESGTLGNASYEDKHINLYRNEKDIGSFEEWEKKAGSILLHEVQHIIQGIEGFAKGSNPKMFEENPEASELSKALASYRSYTKEQLQNFSVNQEKQNYRDLGMTDAQIAELSKDVEGLGTVEEIIERGVKEHGAEWMYNEIQYAVKEVDKAGKIVVDGKSFMSNMEAYMVSAGEVESRNVQARMRFTPEQRNNTLLSATADFAPEDQIIIFDGLTSESRTAGVEERNVALEETVQKEYSSGSITASIKSALVEKAEPLVTIDFTQENYDRLFPFGIVQTPIEKVKLGENQFEKLDANNRSRFLLATYQTLATPDIVIDENRNGSHSHNYIKSFIFDEKTKAVQDIVVSIDGENVSITAHPRDINNIVNKIKTPDQLVYAAEEVGRMIEQRVQNELGIVNPTRVDRLSTISVPLNKEYSRETALSTIKEISEKTIFSKERNVALETDKQEKKMENPSSENISYENEEYWKTQFLNDNAETFKALDDFLNNGIKPKNDEFIFSKVPEILKSANVSENEIVIRTSIINKARNEHSLSADEIRKAIENIAAPVLIFDSDRKSMENKKNSYLSLTDTFAKNGKPVAFSMNLDSEYEKNRSILTVNEIRTIHDRALVSKNGVDLIQKWTTEGLCRYVDDKKISEWQLAAGVQFPLAVLHSDNFRIQQSDGFVNEVLSFSKFTDEQQEKEKEYREWLSINSPDEESGRRIDSGEIFGTYNQDEKQSQVLEEFSKEAEKSIEVLKQYQQKYPVSTLDVSSDVKEQLNIVFEQINSYFDNGISPKDGRFILPEVPEYMANTGSDKTPISLPVAVIKKARDVHQLNNDEIKNSILKLYDPIAVFESDKEKSENKANSKLILTDEFTNQSKPIVLAININSNIKISNGKKALEVQDIRSIHDRTLIANNGTDLIQKWTQDGLCRYVDEKKITEWSNVARVYFPIDELNSAENKILTKSELVNSHTEVEQRNVALETSEERNMTELKTYHTLKEEDVKNLEIISDEDFSNIVDSIILNDYKNIPNTIRLPNINSELAEKLGLEKDSAFIMKKSATHIRPDRKGSYNQALDTEEYRMIPKVMRDATFALVDKRVKNFQILFDDKNDIKKINKIVFNKDELGNYLVTIGKVGRQNSISEKENIVVGVGVAPTISDLRFPKGQPATRLRPSPTTVNSNIAQNKEKSTEKQTLPPYVKTLNSLIDQAVKEEKISVGKTQDGETKQKKQTPPNLTKKAADDFLRAVQEETAPFFNMQNDDFGKITMTPQLIVNAQTGLPFKDETQLLAQIYSAEQDMNGQIVTSMEGAKEAGTYIKKCDEAMKNFVLVNQQHLSGENKVMPTRYFSPEAAENPDMVYANVLHKNRPAKIKSFRKLCLHFERLPEGQKDIQVILTKIAWEHLKELQRELKLPDGWKTENLTEKDIIEKKEYIKNYFEKVPARERTVFQETFGICTDIKKEYGDPAFSDKTRKIMDDKLTQFIKDNSFSAEYLAAFTKEEYDKLEDWKKEKGRQNKIEAVGIKEPEVYLGRYLAACNSHAEFITDAETIKVIKEKLSTKLKQNYKLEKYDILKEIGMQAGNICKETMKQNVFSKAHSHDKKQELSVQKDKQHPPVGMGASK
ncbi:LPD23 domain-containing protein [uncultured Treponema sp.]|uniref:MuF-C-terminal domain-containing protein n=1 Tax=uncultured Treponema sp. TaxID=162155 RepID=UPI00259A7AC6|nr:LPD23 domain-containing protein [uncultured Treponema sp.]